MRVVVLVIVLLGNLIIPFSLFALTPTFSSTQLDSEQAQQAYYKAQLRSASLFFNMAYQQRLNKQYLSAYENYVLTKAILDQNSVRDFGYGVLLFEMVITKLELLKLDASSEEEWKKLKLSALEAASYNKQFLKTDPMIKDIIGVMYLIAVGVCKTIGEDHPSEVKEYEREMKKYCSQCKKK